MSHVYSCMGTAYVLVWNSPWKKRRRYNCFNKLPFPTTTTRTEVYHSFNNNNDNNQQQQNGHDDAMETITEFLPTRNIDIPVESSFSQFFLALSPTRTPTLSMQHHIVALVARNQLRQHRFCTTKLLHPSKSVRRRKLFNTIVFAVTGIFGQTQQPLVADAAGLIGKQTQQQESHRQLELCLVTMLRLLYWAQYTSNNFNTLLVATTTTTTTNDDNNEQQQRIKMLYVETRLCAKAMLTGKYVGGTGSTATVYRVTSFQIPGCLSDLQYYATFSSSKSTKTPSITMAGAGAAGVVVVQNAARALYEGLASIVEFDGFDSLIDPIPPRTSLTFQQYNIDKVKYIQRTIQEIIIPSTKVLINYNYYNNYDSSSFLSSKQIAEEYIEQYYKNEIYTPPQQITAASTATPFIIMEE